MSETSNNIPLPEHKEGSKKDFESEVTTHNIEEAKKLYATAKERLLNVNQWHSICGKLSAVFQLANEAGEHIDDVAKKGYHFKIDILGPGSTSGEGYDWVQVEDVQEAKDDSDDSEYILMTVRPTDNPAVEDENVAHFFSNKATSNFVVKREGTKVIAAIYGRNEVPNTSTGNIIDKARNAIIGASALAGGSNPQWKSLADGLLGK